MKWCLYSVLQKSFYASASLPSSRCLQKIWEDFTDNAESPTKISVAWRQWPLQIWRQRNFGDRSSLALKLPSSCQIANSSRVCVGNSMISSDISKLLYVISRAVRRVKFETILNYHEWYLCQISRTNHAIICLYYYPQKVVIFTCRYCKLSWNTTALSQSDSSNFACSSILLKRHKQYLIRRQGVDNLNCRFDYGIIRGAHTLY